jgi:hypothetical protein
MEADKAAGPLGSASSEGLGPTQPEREDHERAYNAGFVESSRLHGQEIKRLRAYVNAAHWWAEAHENELIEAGDTRFDARSRMLDAEAALLAAGHVFERA